MLLASFSGIISFAGVQRPSRKIRSRFFVGLMSGTSADGIDAVVAELSGLGSNLRARLLAHTYRPFGKADRERILAACAEGSAAEICELNFRLGEAFASAALTAIKQASLATHNIAAIGSHGQTVHHLPGRNNISTLQIGEPCVIAERLGITTVADFRVRDVAAGGQGAPLVPYADWALFTHRSRPRIIQNIGGIANLTFLPARCAMEQVLAFDTGPGNMVMDGAVGVMTGGAKAFDSGGRIAASGCVCAPLLNRMLQHPFLRKKPPRTTGREEFGQMFLDEVLGVAREFGLPPRDAVATLCRFTAVTIANAWKRYVFPLIAKRDLPRLEAVIGGGGAKNPTLLRMLSEQLPGVSVRTHEDFGIPNAAKEALAFAILARETLAGRPGNIPGATGARHPVILGKIVPA